MLNMGWGVSIPFFLITDCDNVFLGINRFEILEITGQDDEIDLVMGLACFDRMSPIGCTFQHYRCCWCLAFHFSFFSLVFFVKRCLKKENLMYFEFVDLNTCTRNEKFAN